MPRPRWARSLPPSSPAPPPSRASAATGRRARQRAHAAARRRGARRGGTLLGALATSAGLALTGIALAGAGISICAPVLFSIAGRSADEAVRGAAVSIVTTIAYLGFLVGPAAVGLLADATALRTSLASVAAVGGDAGDPGARGGPALGSNRRAGSHQTAAEAGG